MKKLMYLAAMAAFALASCQPAPEPEPIGPEWGELPKAVEETLTALPDGTDAENTLTLAIEAEGAWKIEAADEYDWITVTPVSGEGNATLTFEVAANETDKDRLAEFDVKETFVATNAELVDNGEATEKDVKTYSIVVNQVKKESNVNPGSLAFLKAIVEGQLLGADTPAVDNWYVVDETFPGINLDAFDQGKLEVVSIWGATSLCGFPEVMDLPELTGIYLRDVASLNGKELPKVWNTPNLTYCNISVCKMTGSLPEGMGSTTPKCAQFLLDQNNFYGALPHVWASGVNGGTGVCEIFILANVNNRKSTPEEGFLNNDNDGFGYMIPATFDSKLNHLNDAGERENTPDYGYAQNDGTAVKVGGVFQGNYIGYEKGWGQERYVKFGNGAAEDKATWSNYRAHCAAGGWAWYYSNLGYVDADETVQYYFGVPQVMMDWDQAAADAYTAEAKTKWAM